MEDIGRTGKPQDGVTILAGQDTLQSEDKPSSGEKALEPSTPPELLTKEQVDKLLSERHSTLDKRIAELEKQGTKAAKALELTTKRANDAEAVLAKTLKEKDEEYLEGIKDNPDALSIYQAKQRQRERDAELSEREQELEASKAEHEETLSVHRKWKIEQEADKIAADYEGLAGSLLIQLTDGSPEKMKLLAGQLGTLKVKQPIIPRPDSGLHSGGAGKLTDEQIEKMPTEDYAKHPSVKERYK